MIDPSHAVAVAVALAAAFSNGAQNLFIRLGTDEGRASNAVLVVMLVNLVVLLPPICLVYYPAYRLTPVSVLSFVAAGILGTFLGRLLLYTSIDRIGASRTSPIIASNALVATALGLALLGETLSPVHAVGIVLIVGGVAVIAWETSHENPDDLPSRQLLISLLIPFGAAFAYGFEPIAASYGFAEGTPAPVGLVVKTTAATLGFALYLIWRDALPSPSELYMRSTRWFVLAGIANSLFLLGYYLALEIGPVNVVVPIKITYTLFVVALSALFMPERLERVTWKLAAAALVVVGGVVIVTVYG